jgi:hypothetical protein
MRIVLLLFLSGFFGGSTFTLMAQTPVLNQPLSFSIQGARQQLLGPAVDASSILGTQQEKNYFLEIALSYRVWKNWGIVAKWDHAVHPANVEAMARLMASTDANTRSVFLQSGEFHTSLAGLGGYMDFFVTKSLFIRTALYGGVSFLRTPEIIAEVNSAPLAVYQLSPGLNTGYFLDLQVKPSYSVHRNFRVHLLLSASGALHNLSIESNQNNFPLNGNLNFLRLGLGLGIEHALPWPKVKWKY